MKTGEMMDDEKKMKEDKKMMEDAKSKGNEDEGKEDCCCCSYPTVLIVLGALIWVAGLLIFINLIGMFLNQYFQWWYPFINLLLFLLYVGGLVMIASWFCKDS